MPTEVSGPPDPRTEYVYGRLKVPGRVAQRFLSREGNLFVFNEDGDADGVLYAYCATREEAMEFAKDVFGLGVTLQSIGEDLREFVKTYESEKWED